MRGRARCGPSDPRRVALLLFGACPPLVLSALLGKQMVFNFSLPLCRPIMHSASLAYENASAFTHMQNGCKERESSGLSGPWASVFWGKAEMYCKSVVDPESCHTKRKTVAQQLKYKAPGIRWESISIYYNVCYTCPNSSLPRVLRKVLRRSETWAKSGACVVNRERFSLVHSASIGL